MYHSLFNHSPIVGHILVVSSLGLLQSKRLNYPAQVFV